MLVAETDGRCQHTVDGNPVSVRLDIHTSGMYTEIQVINYLGEPLYSVDHQNVHTIIAATYQGCMNRKVIVRYRTVVGGRSMDSFGNETTKCQHHTVVIPESVLREQPVFIESVNKVICTSGHIDDVFHPHSTAYIDCRMRALFDNLVAESINAPVVIIANDPTATYDHLYLSIQGVPCAVKVTHYVNDIDTIRIGFRDQPHAASRASQYSAYLTTFAELEEAETKVLTKGPCLISTDAVWLHEELTYREQSPENTVRLSEVTAMLDRARNHSAQELAQAKEECDNLKRQLVNLKNSADILDKANYSERTAAIQLTNLELEEMKLKQRKTELVEEAFVGRIKQETEQKIESIKVQKELWGAAKVIAAAIPAILTVGFSIYKIWNSGKS